MRATIVVRWVFAPPANKAADRNEFKPDFVPNAVGFMSGLVFAKQ
jgi:hypothetical protein